MLNMNLHQPNATKLWIESGQSADFEDQPNGSQGLQGRFPG